MSCTHKTVLVFPDRKAAEVTITVCIAKELLALLDGLLLAFHHDTPKADRQQPTEAKT